MPAMLGCSTICPHCRHQFTCCAALAPPPCCSTARSTIVSTGGGGGGGIGGCPSPQVSPSAPLSFVLPSFAVAQPPPQPPPETEVVRLSQTFRALRISGWYYERMPFERSDALLKDASIGTFLVRDSADPRYLFSLSMKTEQGPKSVRLFYSDGYFRLDAQPHLRPSMPLFVGVLELVQHYVRRRKKDNHIWVDPQGKCPGAIRLERPLRREGAPPSLKHLSRLAINRQLGDEPKLKIFRLELPDSLATYLAEYPYSL